MMAVVGGTEGGRERALGRRCEVQLAQLPFARVRVARYTRVPLAYDWPGGDLTAHHCLLAAAAPPEIHPTKKAEENEHSPALFPSATQKRLLMDASTPPDQTVEQRAEALAKSSLELFQSRRQDVPYNHPPPLPYSGQFPAILTSNNWRAI